MPLYLFRCTKCHKEFESIEVMGEEITVCKYCEYGATRMHGQELPSPPKLVAGIGGFYSPSYGDRKYG